MFKADLHVHTTFSDGTMSPTGILQLAKEKGLSGLSFTDHENIFAYEDGKSTANKLGLFLIPGVELSTTVGNNQNIHLLAYSFIPEKMQPIIEEYVAVKVVRNQLILEKLKKHRMEITDEDLTLFSKKLSTVGRVHIAQAMQRKGFVNSVDQAFKQWLGDSQPCFIKMNSFNVEETIAQIHSAGGLAVIAHPHLIRSRKTLDTLYELPFDGVEANYALFSKEKSAQWVEWAKQKGWFCTAGSDFHGSIKKKVTLGCNFSGKEVFDTLFNHYQSHGKAND